MTVETVTPGQVEEMAAKVKKAAILRQVKEDYLPSDSHTSGNLDDADMSKPPEEVQKSGTGQGIVPAPRDAFNIRTPGGWEAYKASFDWIEERFKQYTKRGMVSQFEAAKSSLHSCRTTLQDSEIMSGKPDLYGGRDAAVAGVMDEDLWDKNDEGKTITAFLQYMAVFGAREANCALVVESLWHGLNADQGILALTYGQLLAIASETVKALTGTSDGGEYNLNSKVSYQIVGAITGTAVALVATYATAGSAGVSAANIGLAVFQGTVGILGEAFGSDDKTKPKDPKSKVKSIDNLKEKEIQISGSDTQTMLGSMLSKISEMDGEIDKATWDVWNELNKTYAAVTAGYDGNKLPEYGGQSLLVGPRPALSDAGKSGKVKPLLF